MARPREGDGIKRTVVTRGGKLYAYECTSRMVNGRKVSESKYVGRVDPATGEIIEKKPRRAEAGHAKDGIVRPAGGFVSKEFGNIHFLNGIQAGMGLEEDLIKAFGLFGRTVLGLAAAQTVDPGAFMDTEHTFRRTAIGEMFDIGRSVSSPRISELTRMIGEASDCMDLFFERRLGRSGDIIAWDTTSGGTHSVRTGLAEWAPGKDGEKMRQVKIGLATDGRGVPILFEIFPGSVSDVTLTKRFTASVRGRGKDCIFVMDNGFESAGNTASLLDDGVRFVMPADTSPKAVKKLLTEFQGHPDVRDRIHGGHAYRVWETELGIVPDPKRTAADGSPAYTYLSAYDSGFAECPVKVRAFVCYDSKKYSDEEQNLRIWLDRIEKELDGKEFRRPMDTFFETAGKAAKYFDAECCGNVLRLSRKQNAVSFADNRAGTFVMLASPGIPWEVMMSAYDARCLTEQAFDAYKNGLDGRRLRTGDKYAAKGRLFVKLIALMMRCEISAGIREKKLEKMTVDGILRSAGNIMAVRYGDAAGITEVTKLNREICKAFGIPVPTDRDITNM